MMNANSFEKTLHAFHFQVLDVCLETQTSIYADCSKPSSVLISRNMTVMCCNRSNQRAQYFNKDQNMREISWSMAAMRLSHCEITTRMLMLSFNGNEKIHKNMPFSLVYGLKWIKISWRNIVLHKTKKRIHCIIIIIL